jgi:hypothetical protein
MPVAETLTPDGAGDDERGIQQVEDYANSSPQGTVLFADPHYREYRPGNGDESTERLRKERADRRNAASPSIHHMSGMATSSAASLRATRRASMPVGFGTRQMPKIVPGGGYAPPSHRSANVLEPAIAEEEIEDPPEVNIANAAKAAGRLVVSHSSQPPASRSGPEIYLG